MLPIISQKLMNNLTKPLFYIVYLLNPIDLHKNNNF